ncbi:Serpin B9 [Saguinus oedipus]|uniref:Serpin B9 n=1 Tax=Saguinus oedipus TaxID=9490 RepID=A0ABQ9VXB0_SAGOE|nr:Serpin B9 [Saguinus oedipus]
METFSNASGTFAIQLLKLLCEDNPSGNVFCSPMSISSALAMVLLGAKGNTATQMAQHQNCVVTFRGVTLGALHGSSVQLDTPEAANMLSAHCYLILMIALSLNTEEDIHQGFQLLLTEVNKPGTAYLLRTANGLFGEKTCKFLSTFKESCLQFYHAELKQLSFIKAAEESRKHINTWVSEKTEVTYKSFTILNLVGALKVSVIMNTTRKIEELLPVSSIDAETRLVLVNAIYFKGKWNEWFDETYTREMPFKINQEEQRPVQMMYQEAFFMLAHVGEVGVQLLELPYAGEELSLLVLLPDDGVELSTVEKNLTFEKLTAWTKPDCMKSTEVEVHLPKFKLQEDYDMASVLPRLGMVDAFQRGKADLSAMSAERDLCLSKFVHKTFVEVNEEGTEAVAASGMLVEAECSKESGPRFCADHPFLFFIRHNRANRLLFCGRFSSP